jgi:hypothetical protein
MMPRELLISHGENKAVRAFLRLYGGTSSVSVGMMRAHLTECGFAELWPGWVIDQHKDTTITKSGAQDWLRYLFSLEQQKGSE